MSSGYSSIERFNVVKLPSGSRVNVHAFGTREHAQSEADRLNAGEMVADHADDPRPYAVRQAEADAAYEAETGRKVYR